AATRRNIPGVGGADLAKRPLRAELRVIGNRGEFERVVRLRGEHTRQCQIGFDSLAYSHSFGQVDMVPTNRREAPEEGCPHDIMWAGRNLYLHRATRELHQ